MEILHNPSPHSRAYRHFRPSKSHSCTSGYTASLYSKLHCTEMCHFSHHWHWRGWMIAAARASTSISTSATARGSVLAVLVTALGVRIWLMPLIGACAELIVRPMPAAARPDPAVAIHHSLPFGSINYTAVITPHIAARPCARIEHAVTLTQ